MVCNRCIMILQQELDKLSMAAEHIDLGEAVLMNKPTKEQLLRLKERLHKLGFELIEDAKKKMIEKIKTLLLQKIQLGEIEEHFSVSKFLSNHFKKDYAGMGRLFSDVESITIEHYFILQKIEKVKEWLAYNELTLSEIAWKLGYSNVGHLSAQFKKATGLTASHFKNMGNKRRTALDKI